VDRLGIARRDHDLQDVGGKVDGRLDQVAGQELGHAVLVGGGHHVGGRAVGDLGHQPL
jgi:hypothetical protein